MKKQVIICCLLASLFVLGACSDVEGVGDPQPRLPRVEVESAEYYIQITQENLGGVAFVYRWLNLENASKYVITLGAEEQEDTIDVVNKSTLTYNGVREQQFTNQDILGYLHAFGLLATDSREALMTITLEALNADGAPINAEAAKASKTSNIHVVIAPDVDLTTN
ncbi:hypothetical protein [Bacteroides reticulotermitis]|uniref:Uncharacterized protein n=2 Tax=Bacteroides reticulotermitis TaxID=1133319 RepID=W4UTL7_9BACE|nr:hypothetical protein [Bacteroides reticulotermitis]MBB4044186.1 hypothetical protein [Bacteroides reticulotermitis]GAE83854.1 hypothetical protein JCM10512_2152 [Bacteroides reticulotermitis JCM 10512]HJD76361.1 hypothetical protein [Bacteroides reticulotermitis]